MTVSTAIALLDRHAGAVVAATLIECVDTAYANRTDGQWATFAAAEALKARLAGKPLPDTEHAHWLWGTKVSLVSHLVAYPTLSIECEGVSQGLMLLKTYGALARIPAELGRSLVYVVYLSTAPWNLRSALHPRFAGVGTAMLRAAIETSRDLGFKGRIGLHALPQSEQFYRESGMTEFDHDVDKQNLKYFEMSPAQAAAFLK